MSCMCCPLARHSNNGRRMRNYHMLDWKVGRKAAAATKSAHFMLGRGFEVILKLINSLLTRCFYLWLTTLKWFKQKKAQYFKGRPLKTRRANNLLGKCVRLANKTRSAARLPLFLQLMSSHPLAFHLGLQQFTFQNIFYK